MFYYPKSNSSLIIFYYPDPNSNQLFQRGLSVCALGLAMFSMAQHWNKSTTGRVAWTQHQFHVSGKKNVEPASLAMLCRAITS